MLTGINGTTDNNFYLGDKTDGYKIIYAYDSDINNPGIRWNDNDNKWEFSNDGTIWKNIEESISIPILETSGGTGQTTYIPGDLLYSDGSDSLNKLAIGNEDQTLTVSGGLPSWQNLTGVLVETATENVAGGTGALANLTSGNYNTAFGYNAGNSLTTGNHNVLLGNNAGKSIDGYSYNVIISCDNNVAPDYNGQYSVIIGTIDTGSSLIHDEYNVLIGNYVGTYLTGDGNTFVGNYCGQGIGSSSYYNSGLGYQAFGNSTPANNISYCIALGYNAFSKLSSATEKSIAIGPDAGDGVAGGTEQICIGNYSGYDGCGDYSVAIGSYSGGGDGEESIAIGRYAKFKNYNKAIAIGPYCETNDGYSLVISSYGTVGSPTQSEGEYTATLGYHSLYLGKKIAEDISIYADKGDANPRFLRYSNAESRWVYSNNGLTYLYVGIYGTNHNNFINLQGGEYDGYYHLTEEEYTWVTDGYYSLKSENVIIGDSADGYQREKGIAIGKSASVGDWGIAIGYQATTSGFDRIAIGYGSAHSVYGTCYIGHPTVNPIDLSAASYVNYSDIRMKKNIKPLQYGLEVINSLNPVEFYYDTDVGSDSYKKKHIGLIAQEVKETSDIIEDWGVVSQDSDCWKLDYIQFISPLIKAVQQLNDKIEEQQKQIEYLEILESENKKVI